MGVGHLFVEVSEAGVSAFYPVLNIGGAYLDEVDREGLDILAEFLLLDLPRDNLGIPEKLSLDEVVVEGDSDRLLAMV